MSSYRNVPDNNNSTTNNNNMLSLMRNPIGMCPTSSFADARIMLLRGIH